MIENNFISHREKLQRKNIVPSFDSNEAVDQLIYVDDIEEGIVVKQVKVVSNRFESNKELKVTDFNIRNLQAIGADKGLKEFRPELNIKTFEQSIIDVEAKIDEYEAKIDEYNNENKE